MRRPILVVVLLAALAACEAEGTDEPATAEATATATPTVAVSESPAPPDAEGTRMMSSGEAPDSGCGADKLGRWLNVLPTDDVKREIAATVGERPIRYYGQGDPITMDFSPARLNVELGPDGRIKLFRCG